MPLALFDLDNTLLAGDSDYAWGEFLVREKKVDADHYARMNTQFYEDYQLGKLDIFEYLRFALAPLAALEPQELLELHDKFMAEVVSQMWLPAAEALVENHRRAGDRLVVISATNRFIVEPICQRFGIGEVIATELEQKDGRYTGNVAGVPSYQQGKVTRLQGWLEANGETLEGSSFYSDSINDLPLLAEVDKAVAVNPDDLLSAEASKRGWPILDLRGA
ncbi:MAG: HAD family hydrolase [Porticoccaceae bacterium]|nr:HAD family hydrolase [Porticoccaceae bacterium]OUS10585.1 phosphoserine phosphatase [Gammaproteobacteria bacterium 54_18_T64]